jgi:hypothetical protein
MEGSLASKLDIYLSFKDVRAMHQLWKGGFFRYVSFKTVGLRKLFESNIS